MRTRPYPPHEYNIVVNREHLIVWMLLFHVLVTGLAFDGRQWWVGALTLVCWPVSDLYWFHVSPFIRKVGMCMLIMGGASAYFQMRRQYKEHMAAQALKY